MIWNREPSFIAVRGGDDMVLITTKIIRAADIETGWNSVGQTYNEIDKRM